MNNITSTQERILPHQTCAVLERIDWTSLAFGSIVMGPIEPSDNTQDEWRLMKNAAA